MSYRHILGRIRDAVHEGSYLVGTAHLEGQAAVALATIGARLESGELEAADARREVEQLHHDGSLDRVMYLSALGVIAASPAVRDYRQAHQLASQQELAALDTGGPRLQTHLASVDRHRGVLAFLMGRYEVALDHFTRALERERTGENLCNVLAALLRLGDDEEARDLYGRVQAYFPADVRMSVERHVALDDDLKALRNAPC